MRYTQLILDGGDEYPSATAKTVDDAKALIETGFEHVRTFDNVMLFPTALEKSPDYFPQNPPFFSEKSYHFQSFSIVSSESRAHKIQISHPS